MDEKLITMKQSKGVEEVSDDHDEDKTNSLIFSDITEILNHSLCLHFAGRKYPDMERSLRVVRRVNCAVN
jgi:hypothetical protein